jgi:hypothetical protein
MPTGRLDRALFSNVVAQREAEQAGTLTSPPLAAKADPETPDQTADQEPSGKDLQPETAPSDETPADAGTDSEDEQQNVLSQTEDTELTEALTGLNADARRKLIEIAKSVKSGDETIGGVKRIHKLTSELEELRAKVTEMEQVSTRDTAPEKGPLPKAIESLKTLKEVEARSRTAEENAEAIQDFLDANPGSADTTYTINGQEFTRQQLIAQRAQWRSELKALPKRAEQLTQAQQFQQQRQAVTEQIRRDYPVLNDGEHPETQAVRQMIRDPKFADVPNAEYLALALLRGHTSLQAETAARRKGVTSTPAKPAGKVPVGKPHTPSTGAASRVKEAGPSVDSVLDRVKKDGSRRSFAELLSATGR